MELWTYEHAITVLPGLAVMLLLAAVLIPVLEQVRLSVAQAAGEVPAKLLYIVIVSALNVVFVFGAQMLCRLVYKLLKKTSVPVAK